MLLNNGSKLLPLKITGPDAPYIITCLDNLFKMEKVVVACHAAEGILRTALLGSPLIELAEFKTAWKELQDRWIFKKHKDLRVIGTVERQGEGDFIGQLHAHLTLWIPGGTSNAKIKQIEADLAKIWADILKKKTGKAIRTNRRGLEAPLDGSGIDWILYSTKPFNRGSKPAKWGKEGNQSYLLTANVRELRLFRRDDLPSRNKESRDWALQKFNKQIQAGSGTLRKVEAVFTTFEGKEYMESYPLDELPAA